MSSREFTQGPYPRHGRCPLRRGSSRARAGGVLRDHAFAPIRAAHHRVRLGPGGQAGQNGVSRSGGDHPHRVATSLDCVLLTEQGIAPPARSIAAAIRACVEAVPVCVGKPGRSMFEMAARQLGLPAGEIPAGGDNLDSDIAGAKSVGARTALLVSGVSAPSGRTSRRGRPLGPVPPITDKVLAGLRAGPMPGHKALWGWARRDRPVGGADPGSRSADRPPASGLMAATAAATRCRTASSPGFRVVRLT
jgi:hypothetical protein